jgi:S1-C subfamily serine protease
MMIRLAGRVLLLMVVIGTGLVCVHLTNGNESGGASVAEKATIRARQRQAAAPQATSREPNVLVPGTTAGAYSDRPSTGTFVWLGASFKKYPGGGVVAYNVVVNGPAWRGNMAAGDIVLAVDGEPVTLARDVLRAAEARGPGQAVSMEIARNGQRYKTVVVPEAI